MTKPILTTFFCLYSLFAFSTILTVSNDPLDPAMYNNGDSAMAAASAGDTIQFHGSVTSYGYSLNVTKKLTIIGPGKYPSTGNKHKAHYRFLNIQSTAVGSSLFGMWVTDGISVTASNCLVSGCNTSGITVSGASNVIIRDCYIANTGNVNPYALYSPSPSPNLLVENNIIYSQMFKVSGATFRNNIFCSGNRPIQIIGKQYTGKQHISTVRLSETALHAPSITT